MICLSASYLESVNLSLSFFVVEFLGYVLICTCECVYVCVCTQVSIIFGYHGDFPSQYWWLFILLTYFCDEFIAGVFILVILRKGFDGSASGNRSSVSSVTSHLAAAVHDR